LALAEKPPAPIKENGKGFVLGSKGGGREKIYGSCDP